MLPHGLPIWTADAMPGHRDDLTRAQNLAITAAPHWAAAELNLSILADAGYDGAGHGLKNPTTQPADGQTLSIANRLLRGLRWQGERGFAILVGRWKTLRHSMISPRGTGDVVAAALHLTHFGYRSLNESC